MKNSNRAFTLVELLVVVAIISVLAALLLPSLENAVESARKAECGNRMKQLATFGHMWENEFKYILPVRMTWDTLRPDLYTPGIVTGNWSSPTMLYYAGYLDKNDLISNVAANPINAALYRFNGPYMEERLRSSSLALCPSGKLFSGMKGPGGGWVYIDPLLEAIPAPDKIPGSTIDRMYDVTSTTRNVGWSSYPFAELMGCSSRQTIHFSDYSENASLVGYLYPGASAAAMPSLPVLRTFSEAPSRMIFFMEAKSPYACWQGAGGWWDGINREYKTGRQYRIPHNDEANYVCYDGHVDSIHRDTFIGAGFGAILQDELPFVFGSMNTMAP